MVWLNNETLNVPVELAHFGEKALQGANIIWKISNQSGEKLAQGSFVKDLPIANCIPAGNIEYALSGIEEPSQLTVSVEVKEANNSNRWNIWVYPAKQKAVEKLPYIASTLDDQVMNRLEKGENVLLLLAPGSILPEREEIFVSAFRLFSGTQPGQTSNLLIH